MDIALKFVIFKRVPRGGAGAPWSVFFLFPSPIPNFTPAFRRLLLLGSLVLTSCWSKEDAPRPPGQCNKAKTPKTGTAGGNN